MNPLLCDVIVLVAFAEEFHLIDQDALTERQH